ncbi:MAG: GNAT family N-acetyltransferase [Candidatus Thorarchaeota archaeon]
MNDIRMISGNREDIPREYLIDLFSLMREYHDEVWYFKSLPMEYYKKNWTIGSSSNEAINWTIALNSTGKVIGYGFSVRNTNYDNLDKAYFMLFVTKNERRKGIGTELLKEIIHNLPEIITTITTEIFESSIDGIAFIQSFNKDKGYQEIVSCSDFSEFNPEEVRKEAQKLKEKALNEGYELIYIEDLNFIFHVNMNDFVKMEEAIWNDMPLEELSYDKEVVTVQRYDEMVQRRILQGNKLYTFIAIHKESGLPIGVTQTRLNLIDPKVAHQMDTGVMHSHRGKGIGLALKYQMLDKLLHETKAQYWETGNAGSNEYMLKINRILKHIPIAKVNIYEFKMNELK